MPPMTQGVCIYLYARQYAVKGDVHIMFANIRNRPHGTQAASDPHTTHTSSAGSSSFFAPFCLRCTYHLTLSCQPAPNSAGGHGRNLVLASQRMPDRIRAIAAAAVQQRSPCCQTLLKHFFLFSWKLVFCLPQWIEPG